MNPLDFTPDDFNAYLAEMYPDGGGNAPFLRQQYREKNNVTSMLPNGGLADGRQPVAGGFASKDAGATGRDAMRSLRPAIWNGIRGLLQGGGEAVQAPLDAYRGLLSPDEMTGAAMGTAGMAMGGGMAASGRGLLDYDPNAVSSNMGWKDRVAQSTPKSWLDAKYDKPSWNPISGVSSRKLEEDMLPAHTPTGTLQPEVLLDLADLKDKHMISAYGDRSVAGVNIEGVGDVEYDNPIRSLGGGDFMREQGTGLWANDLKPAREINNTARELLERGEDPLLTYTSMGAQSGDFSTMMAESVLNLAGKMNTQNPSRGLLDAVDHFDNNARKSVPSFEGLLAPNLERRLFDDHSGSQRWALWQAMDKASLRDAGMPDINMARRAITEPRLLNAVPFDSGLTVGRMSGELLDDVTVPHPSYGTQIGGDYMGGIDTVAGPIMWRDFFEKRRGGNEPVGSDQRSFLMNSSRMSQKVDQQMIDEYSEMKEYLKNIEDPNNPMKLWRRQ